MRLWYTTNRFLLARTTPCLTKPHTPTPAAHSSGPFPASASMPPVPPWLCFLVSLVAITARCDAEGYKPIDWSKLKCAPPVLDQQSCGACYAFAATSGIGASFCHQKGTNVNMRYLSPQLSLNLVHLSGVKENPCSGGSSSMLVEAWARMKQTSFSTCSDVCSTGCLPYEAGRCDGDDAFTKNKRSSYRVGGSSATCPTFTGTGCKTGLGLQTHSSVQLVQFWEKSRYELLLQS